MKERKQTSSKLFKVLEFITEILGWVQIVALPALVGIVIGALIIYPNPTMIRLVFGVITAALGVAVGVLWATKQWKGKGTMWLISRTTASPELDRTEEEETND